MKRRLIEKYLHPLTPIATAVKPGGAITEKVRCVLFDLYGTLFISGSGDTQPCLEPSSVSDRIACLLMRYGIRKKPKVLLEALDRAIRHRHRELRGQGVDFPEVKIDRIWKAILPEDNLDIVRRFAVEFELLVNPVYPMPNLAKMLDACRRRSIRMGVISNAQFYTPLLFEWFLDSDPVGLGMDPELVFYSYRFEIAKPSTRLFELAAEKLRAKGIAAGSALYLGNDMLKDVYPAKAVGFQTALFAGDQRSLRLRTDNRRCRNISADLVITDLDQLIPCLIRFDS